MSKKKKKCQKYYCQGSAIFQGGDINLVSVVDSRGVQSCKKLFRKLRSFIEFFTFAS